MKIRRGSEIDAPEPHPVVVAARAMRQAYEATRCQRAQLRAEHLRQCRAKFDDGGMTGAERRS